MGKPSKMTLENLVNNYAMEVLSDEQWDECQGLYLKDKIQYLVDMGFMEPEAPPKPQNRVEELMEEITEQAKSAVELHGHHIETSHSTHANIESIVKHEALTRLYRAQPIGWLRMSHKIDSGIHIWTFILA